LLKEKGANFLKHSVDLHYCIELSCYAIISIILFNFHFIRPYTKVRHTAYCSIKFFLRQLDFVYYSYMLTESNTAGCGLPAVVH